MRTRNTYATCAHKQPIFRSDTKANVNLYEYCLKRGSLYCLQYMLSYGIQCVPRLLYLIHADTHTLSQKPKQNITVCMLLNTQYLLRWHENHLSLFWQYISVCKASINFRCVEAVCCSYRKLLLLSLDVFTLPSSMYKGMNTVIHHI